MAISAAQVMELRSTTGAGMMDCKKALEETGGDLAAAKDYLRKKGIAIAQKKAARETKDGSVAIRLSPDGRQAAMVQLACETDFVARNEQFQALLNFLADQVLAKGGEDLANQPLIQGKGTVDELITESVGKMGENLLLMNAARVGVEGEGRVGGYVHSNQKIGVMVTLTTDQKVDPEALESLGKDIAMHIAASPVNAIHAEQIDPALVEKEREIYTAQAKESGKPDAIIEKMVQGRVNKFIKENTLLDQPFVKDPDRTIHQLLAEKGSVLGAKLTVTQFVKYQF